MTLTRADEAKAPAHVFDRFFAELPAWFKRPMRAWQEEFADELIQVDEFTEGSTLVIRAELPGIDPEKDVDISVEDGALHIEAHRREEETKEDKNYVRKELRYGSFARILPLPAGATADDVKATYNDGILEIRMPVPEAPVAEVKKVPVTKG